MRSCHCSDISGFCIKENWQNLNGRAFLAVVSLLLPCRTPTPRKSAVCGASVVCELALTEEVTDCQQDGPIGPCPHFSFRDRNNAFAAIYKCFERADFVGTWRQPEMRFKCLTGDCALRSRSGQTTGRQFCFRLGTRLTRNQEHSFHSSQTHRRTFELLSLANLPERAWQPVAIATTDCGLRFAFEETSPVLYRLDFDVYGL
ncbi:hypothetical protein R75465_07578 [Paraburkholderia aspalathi]|nr:hypothetical protein R75465_07578 [Paraburkholderia aspalathi]